MPLKCSNSAQCVCLTKMLEKMLAYAVMYKSLDAVCSFVLFFGSFDLVIFKTDQN